MSVVTYGFHWAEETIGNDLSAGRGDSETDSLVLGNVVTGGPSVDILEDLIESELSETLSGVTEESWSPSLKVRYVRSQCALNLRV